MGSLREAYQKEGEARQRATTQESGNVTPSELSEPKLKVNKTFAEIREDDATSARFLRFLESNGRKDIQEAVLLAEQEPERVDRQMMQKLGAEKQKFLLLMERAQDTIRSLDARAIAKLAETNPDLRDVMDWGGSERINEALRNKLPEIAIDDPFRFGMLARSVEDHANEEKGSQEQEKQIRATFKKWAIVSDATIAKLLHGDDPEGAAREIAERLAEEEFKKNKWSWKNMFRDGAGAKSIKEFQIKAAKEIANFANLSEADLKNQERSIAAARENIAAALEATVMRNKDVHDAVIKGVYGAPIEGVETISIKDAGKMMKFDRDNVRSKWEQKATAYRNKTREVFIGSKLEKWLQEQRETAWRERMAEVTRKEAIKRLGETGISEDQMTEEQISEKIDELRQNYENLPDGEKDRLWELFLREYEDPEPPQELMEEWEKDVPDVSLEEMGSLQSEFTNDYATSHISSYAKGKKPSYISRAISALFKDVLLTDLFGGSQHKS